MRAAYEAASAVVARLGDEESWLPTGCTGWAVRDLVFHCLHDAQRGLVALHTPAGRARRPGRGDVLAGLASGHRRGGERPALGAGEREHVPGLRAVAGAVSGDVGGGRARGGLGRSGPAGGHPGACADGRRPDHHARGGGDRPPPRPDRPAPARTGPLTRGPGGGAGHAGRPARRARPGGVERRTVRARGHRTGRAHRHGTRRPGRGGGPAPAVRLRPAPTVCGRGPAPVGVEGRPAPGGTPNAATAGSDTCAVRGIPVGLMRHPAPHEHPPSINSYVDRVMAGPGGAMTDEVGVITGDLTVATILLSDGRSVRVAVQHSGSDTWYPRREPRPRADRPTRGLPPGTCWAGSAGAAEPAPPGARSGARPPGRPPEREGRWPCASRPLPGRRRPHSVGPARGPMGARRVSAPRSGESVRVVSYGPQQACTSRSCGPTG
ncbi:hypothetical protein LT493_43985 [Streptomyces tricolor]|nr:hypothetical protein [Streptomyces tricolor]